MSHRPALSLIPESFIMFVYESVYINVICSFGAFTAIALTLSRDALGIRADALLCGPFA